MQSTQTVHELVEQLYGAEFVKALDQVNINGVQEQPDAETDDLTAKYLPPDVHQAFQHVQVEREIFGVGLEIRELRFYVSLRGLSLLLIVFILAAFVLGTAPVLTFLRTLMM